jgi:hypothetical protein
VTSPDPLVARPDGAVGAWDGVWIAEDLGDLVAGIRSGNWIDTSIGGFAASMDALAFVTDPLGTLVSWGVAWLMEHVKPLHDALDRLAGDPGQLTAYAQTWHNVAASVRQAGADLAAAVGRDLAGWTGVAGDAYRGRARSHAAALGAMGDAAEAIGVIVEGAGLVVALVRQFVRDLIAEFVSVLGVRLWEWLAEEAGTLGIGTPWVIAQVSTLVAKWAAKITKLLHALVGTLRRLAGKIGELGKLIEALRALIKRGRSAETHTHGSPLFSRSGALSNREVVERNIGLPRIPDTVDHYARLAQVDLHGARVDIIDGVDDIAYLDFQNAVARTDYLGIQLGPAAFQDEETLVRTLGHESVHVSQYAAGRVSTMTGPLEDEAYAAEDQFVENWRRNSR